MTNRNYSETNHILQNYRSNTFNNENERYKLPAIHNTSTVVSNPNTTLPVPAGLQNSMQQVPISKTWSSNRISHFDKTNSNKNLLGNQTNDQLPARPMTSGPRAFDYSSSNINVINGQKTVVRDQHLANEILQKAGISPNITGKDCLEVITDVPVTTNENVNRDPNPLCMKKPADKQEFYEQSIFVRHLQPPKPVVPSPIIIREHCTQPIPLAQPPIVIRHIPPRPPTPPPLIIRERPPSILNLNEPTIIDREVPPPPPPPRQVIVERLPTPPSKPRSIILEKWLPYEESRDRPCIVEKAVANDMPPPKNVIIHYEAREPKIQPQCIDEGISYVDPKRFIDDKPNGNVEVCYVDELNNLPDHIKSQLSPQVLAAIGIQNGSNKQTVNCNPPPILNQQQTYVPSTSMSQPVRPGHKTTGNDCYPTKIARFQPAHTNSCRQHRMSGGRGISTPAAGLPHCYNKHNTNTPLRPSSQGLTQLNRGYYNPWATTYQVSYTNKARGLCRAR